MSQRTKQRRQFALSLLLYDRPLHPEIFRRIRSEEVERRAYRASVHLIDGGHLVEFEAGGSRLSEVVVDGPEDVPQIGLIEHVPCRGEHCHEAETHENVRYMLSTQEEQLPDALYEATKQEILDYARQRELMWAQVPAQPAQSDGTPGRGPFLGCLDVERRANELLVQSFHLYDEFNMVLKTQGIIEAVKLPAAGAKGGAKIGGRRG